VLARNHHRCDALPASAGGIVELSVSEHAVLVGARRHQDGAVVQPISGVIHTGVRRLAAPVQRPVDVSYSSALACTPEPSAARPPTTSTRPSQSKVPVNEIRPTFLFPVDVQVGRRVVELGVGGVPSAAGDEHVARLRSALLSPTSKASVRGDHRGCLTTSLIAPPASSTLVIFVAKQ
jgi:hypothetical protein